MPRFALLSLMLLTSVGMTGCYSCNSCGMGCSTGYNNPCDLCSTSYGSSGCGSCSSCGPGGSASAAMMPMSPQMMSQAAQLPAPLNQPGMSNASYPNIVQEPQQATGLNDQSAPPAQGYALPAPPPQFQSLPMVNAPAATPVMQMGYQQPGYQQPVAAPADVNAMTSEQLFGSQAAPQYLTRAQYNSVFPKGKKCSCGMVH